MEFFLLGFENWNNCFWVYIFFDKRAMRALLELLYITTIHYLENSIWILNLLNNEIEIEIKFEIQSRSCCTVVPFYVRSFVKPHYVANTKCHTQRKKSQFSRNIFQLIDAICYTKKYDRRQKGMS